MDYEKKYRNALGWMRSVYPTLNGMAKEDAEHFFPELTESDDKRIWEAIVREFERASNSYLIETYDLSKDKFLAYLEKQKEGEKEVSDLFDSTDSYNKGFRAGREKALQELKEHIKEDKTQCYAYDAGYAAGFIVGKEQGWKEHKAFVKESSKTADSIPSDCVSDAKCEDRSQKHNVSVDKIAQDYVEGVKEYNPEPTWDLMQTAVCYGYHYCEQKEQKPDDDPLDDPKFLKGFDTGREVQRIFDEQKPAEWSEEDDQLIGFIFDLLNSLVWRKEWAMNKKECLERLKSLRPSWKPSKEQMRALNKVINGEVLLTTQHKSLESLSEQLKKL